MSRDEPLARRLLRAALRDALALIGRHTDRRDINAAWANDSHLPLNKDDQ